MKAAPNQARRSGLQALEKADEKPGGGEFENLLDS